MLLHYTESSLSFGEFVALAISLTSLFTLVVGVSIGVLIVLAVNKCTRSENITLQTETVMRPPPCGKDTNTCANCNYGLDKGMIYCK